MTKKNYKFLVFPFYMEENKQNGNKKNYEFIELR